MVVFRDNHDSFLQICSVHILSTKILYIFYISDSITVISICQDNHSQGFASKQWVKILKLMLFSQLILTKNFYCIIIHIQLLPMNPFPLKTNAVEKYCQKKFSTRGFQITPPNINHLLQFRCKILNCIIFITDILDELCITNIVITDYVIKVFFKS